MTWRALLRPVARWLLRKGAEELIKKVADKPQEPPPEPRREG